MTTQPVARPAAPASWPAKSLGEITRVITANATPDVVTEFTAALDDAMSCAKAATPTQQLGPLFDLIESWWPQAVFWTEPEGAQATLDRVADIQKNGLPPKEQRMTSAQFRERFGI